MLDRLKQGSYTVESGRGERTIRGAGSLPSGTLVEKCGLFLGSLRILLTLCLHLVIASEKVLRSCQVDSRASDLECTYIRVGRVEYTGAGRMLDRRYDVLT